MDKLRKKNDILDPLSVIIKLFIYSYKSVGTKISIQYNRVSIQEPGIFQGSVRVFFGDCKNDINILIFPILYSCVKYLTGDSKVKYCVIFERVLLSFDILKDTYTGNEIIYNLDHLKTIISSFLESEEVNPATLVSTYNSPGGHIKQNMYEHINTIWTSRRLSVIFGIIMEILETPSSVEVNTSLLNSLSQYMNSIDLIAYHLISTF